MEKDNTDSTLFPIPPYFIGNNPAAPPESGGEHTKKQGVFKRDLKRIKCLKKIENLHVLCYDQVTLRYSYPGIFDLLSSDCALAKGILSSQ